jgi:hypothetical protein
MITLALGSTKGPATMQLSAINDAPNSVKIPGTSLRSTKRKAARLVVTMNCTSG